MTYKLTATLTHKSKDWGEPVIKQIYYSGDTKDDVLEKIRSDAKVPDHMMHNLRSHGRTAFKDANGVKHTWKLELFDDIGIQPA